MTARLERPATLIALYMILMPLLAGLPRGTVLPILRPSEALQLAVTAGVLAPAVFGLARGQTWRIHFRRTEWLVAALVLTALVIPLLWLAARAEPIGLDEVLAAFPFAKYAALFFITRAAVRSEADARLVVYCSLGTAVVIATIGVLQVLSVGPIVNLIGQFFVSSDADIVDGGRATTTIGSSIATGAYLSISVAIAGSLALSATDRGARRRGVGVAAALVVGALASGQAGTLLGLVVVALVLGWRYGRLKELSIAGLAVGVLGASALWPIVAARIDDLDRSSGLPKSWLVRWVNVSELYWPRLADRGWLLGVSPDATVTPPDVWRDIVYLESGYLWLLWVGGVPLLIASVGFLIGSWRDLSAASEPVDADRPFIPAIAIAGRAAVLMVAVLSVIDPHLTLRAGADLFFVLLAVASVNTPVTKRVSDPAARWRSLLTTGSSEPDDQRPRIQIGEARPAGPAVIADAKHESALAVTVVDRGAEQFRATVSFFRNRTGLHAIVDVADPAALSFSETRTRRAEDPRLANALGWRGIVRCATTMRAASLTTPQLGATADELSKAARLGESLENARAAHTSDFRPTRTNAVSELPVSLPPIRLERTAPIPVWKRTIDLTVAIGVGLVAAPLWGVCAIVVRRSGPGPILFRQLRIGAGGVPFQMYKFRTMHLDNDDSAHREQNRRELLGLIDATKDGDDVRITPIGRWLRKLSLDELPQLLNIIRGEMSLVGPRPSLLWEVELFEPAKRRRLTVRPGLTGLWQTSGRADVSMSEMLELDLAYVDGFGLAIDLRCLAGTARSVLRREGAR